MGTVARSSLIVVGLILVLGLGWYLQHSAEVHDSIRTVGRKPLPPNEILVKQRTSAALPGFGGVVTVKVGDIERARTADLAILGPDATTLTARSAVLVGDRLRFMFSDQEYQLEVLSYRDEIGPGDLVRLRIIAVGPKTRDPENKIVNER